MQFKALSFACNVSFCTFWLQPGKERAAAAFAVELKRSYQLSLDWTGQSLGMGWHMCQKTKTESCLPTLTTKRQTPQAVVLVHNLKVSSGTRIYKSNSDKNRARELTIKG